MLREDGMQPTKLVRVEGNGQVSLPADAREKYGIKDGDIVGIIETSDGLLITTQVALVTKALDEIGQTLNDEGITLDDWIESTRQIRGDLIEQYYGLKPDADD